MAIIINDKGEEIWLGHDDRAKLISEYEEEVELLTRLIRSDKAEGYDLDRMEYLLDEIDRLRRIHRAENDVLYFGMMYFSEDENPDNPDNLIPEGVNVLNSADFHKQLAQMLDDVTANRVDRHIAYAVPRQHAKTAWLSNIFLIHQVVFRHKRYIVLFSETTDVAGDFITWGRYQLKLNEKLRKDFGELLYVQPSQNESDNRHEYITTSGIKVEAKGLGTQTRGLRHGSTRPDLFILDDLESDESTSTAEQIAKAKAWFNDSMMPALARGGMIIYLGTILCYGSLLHYVIEERRDFESRKFAAVRSFADRDDLWEEWRKIYRSDEKDAPEKAREFYEENEDEMLRGVEILWDGFWSYYDLIILREESGVKSFNQEYMNNPTDEERQIFKPEQMTTYDEQELIGKNIRYFGGIDIAMGKSDKSDYTVITTIAKNMDTGVCYVHDAFIERCHPDVLIEKATEYTLKYQYEAIGIEAQFAQEFIADKLAERLLAHGYPSHTRLRYIKQRTRKELRIESMLPDVQNGRLRFRNTLPKIFMEQFEMYPMSNDDAPDSTHMAYSTAQAGESVVQTIAKRAR